MIMNNYIITLIIIDIFAIILIVINYPQILNFFIKPKNNSNQFFEKQKAENYKIVSGIIDTAWVLPKPESDAEILIAKENAKDLFLKWQDKLKGIYDNNVKQEKVLNDFIDENKFFKFKGIYTNQEKPKEGYEIVLENCFSDSFPSLHDMDDWARDKIITVLMVMLNVSVGDSKKYYFHEKQYFVNHDKVQAIFIVDLYKKTS